MTVTTHQIGLNPFLPPTSFLAFAIEGAPLKRRCEMTQDALSPNERSNAVGVGMAIAAGIVLSCWGDDVIACEILGAAGLRTVKDMRDSGVETYDIRLCVPALKVFRDRDALRSSRRAISAQPIQEQ